MTSEPLWNDRRIAERIEQDLTRNRTPYTVLPSRVMEAACEIRDDYERRIAELEAQLEQAVDVVEDTSMESWVSGEKSAERRSEWEPVEDDLVYHEIADGEIGLTHEAVTVQADRLTFTDGEMGEVTVTLPDHIRLCRRTRSDT